MPAHRLALADDALDVLHLGDVDVARLLVVEEVVARVFGERVHRVAADAALRARGARRKST